MELLLVNMMDSSDLAFLVLWELLLRECCRTGRCMTCADQRCGCSNSKLATADAVCSQWSGCIENLQVRSLELEDGKGGDGVAYVNCPYLSSRASLAYLAGELRLLPCHVPVSKFR